MNRNIRNELWALAAGLIVALAGVVGGWRGGNSSLLAFGTVAVIATALLAIGVSWRLALQAQRLERALQDGERLRLLGQVAGGLAHQLRNGVAGAKLALQLHTRACTESDGDSLEVARRQLSRVESDLARFLELGRVDTSRRPSHIVEIVDEAAKLLRPQCRHSDVQLCWEPPAFDPVVVGDAGRLAHIVVNLLTNAVEAAGRGGHVEIVVDQPRDGSCVLEVWDSGPGFAPHVARRLSQPFVTGKSNGVGLGLFVARQAAEAHGGWLEWRRERGLTCFCVELPCELHAAVDCETSVGASR
jgi:hypothetical protein